MRRSRIGVRRARATRPASNQPNSAKTYTASPGPCSRLTACQTPKLKLGSLASVSSAERWSGVPEPTNMRLPNGWGATETGVYMHYLELDVAQNGSAPDTVLRHYHDSASGSI